MINVLLVSMTPLLGIRGALPMALFVYQMTPLTAYVLSVIGEFIPVFFILAFLGGVSRWLSERFLFFKNFFEKLFEKTRRDYDKRLEKHGLLALMIYTAIPLPFSGAWTASLVVFLFGLPYLKSLLSIFLGVLLCGINILIILEMGVVLERYRGFLSILGVLLLAGLIYFLYHRRINGKKNV